MRKAFSIVFLILFLLLFPLSLFSINLKTSILNPTSFKESFRKINFYSRIVKVDPQKVADYINKSSTGETIQAGQIGKLLGYISPEDLQFTVEKNIDQYIASVKKGESNFPIDLTAIKRSVLAKPVDPQTKQLFSQIPDIYTPPQTNQTAKGFSPFLMIGKFLSYGSYVFVALCLILSFFLWPTWRGRLRLLGTVLVILGLLVLIFEIILQRVSIPQNLVADFLDDILRDLILAAKTKFLHFYLVEAIVMIISGFIFWLISFFIKPNPTVAAAPTGQKPAQAK